MRNIFDTNNILKYKLKKWVLSSVDTIIIVTLTKLQRQQKATFRIFFHCVLECEPITKKTDDLFAFFQNILK